MNFDSMSWVLVMALSLSVFSLFIFLFSKFVGYMKRVQNLEIESFKDTLIDKDNPVGLQGEELEKLKLQQAEAQRHSSRSWTRTPRSADGLPLSRRSGSRSERRAARSQAKGAWPMLRAMSSMWPRRGWRGRAASSFPVAVMFPVALIAPRERSSSSAC